MTFPTFMAPVQLHAPSPRFLGGGGPPSGKPLARFPLAKQELPNWCWAAVASGINTTLAKSGNGLSQCVIAGQYASRTKYGPVKQALQPPTCPPTPRCDTVGYLNEVLDLLGHSWHPFRAILPGDQTHAEAMGYLNASLPVPIRIGWRGGGGHFIALVGVDSADAGSSFLVYDPSEAKEDVGHLLVMSEQQLATSYDGIGSWSHIYPVH